MQLDMSSDCIQRHYQKLIDADAAELGVDGMGRANNSWEQKSEECEFEEDKSRVEEGKKGKGRWGETHQLRRDLLTKLKDLMV